MARGLRCRLALGCTCACLAAAPAGAQTFEQALEVAYEQNPALEAARAGLRAADEQVPQELANWRPTVALDSETAQIFADGDIDSGRDSDLSSSASVASTNLTISQPLYRGGRTLAGTRRAKNNVYAERARLLATEQDVLLDAATAYMNVWRDVIILRLNERNESVLAQQLDGAKKRLRLGDATRSDVAQSDARLNRARAARAAASGELADSEARFVQSIGFEPVNAQPPGEVPKLPEESKEAVDLARRTNPNVVSAEFLERAAEAEVELRVGELLPTVTLEGSLGRSQEFFGGGSSANTAEVGLRARIPLYQAGFVSSRVREAKQFRRQRGYEVRDARRRAEQEAKSAWDRVAAARAQIAFFRSEVEASEVALDGIRQAYKAGARTATDYLDAEQDLLDAEVNLVGAKHDEYIAIFEALRAMGRLTAEELALGVEHQDDSSNYESVVDLWFGLEIPAEANPESGVNDRPTRETARRITEMILGQGTEFGLTSYSTGSPERARASADPKRAQLNSRR